MKRRTGPGPVRNGDLERVRPNGHFGLQPFCGNTLLLFARLEEDPHPQKKFLKPNLEHGHPHPDYVAMSVERRCIRIGSTYRAMPEEMSEY